MAPLVKAGLGLALVAALYGALLALGTWSWQRRTAGLVAQLFAARVVRPPQVVDFRSLEGLPSPVQRYLRTVLREGQPLITAAQIAHAGSFNISETGPQWRRFTSRQWIVTRRPGFVWDGNIAVAPGVPFRVHDAYVAGVGMLHPSALGVLSLTELRGTPEIAHGELMRYAAEAPLVPTVLMPGPGVTWAAVNDASAELTLADGTVSVTLLFRFTPEGLVDTVTARARGRTVDGVVVDTPWQGRWSNYELRSGMRVPTRGEVMWLLPAGPSPYWRGNLTLAEYKFAQ